MTKPVNDTTREIADLIKKAIKVDKTGGTTGTEAAYAELLTSKGLSIEGDEKYLEARTQFAAGAGLAFGESAAEVMKEHKDLERATAVFPLAGKDTFTYTFDRSTQVPAGAPKEGEAAQMKTKYGALNIKADYHATKNVGEMAKVKSDLADKALAGWGE